MSDYIQITSRCVAGNSKTLVAAFLWLLWSNSVCPGQEPTQLGSVNGVAVEAELKIVKLYGAGGYAGLDSYQSGFFISDSGHILTVWSTVLDVDEVLAVLSDGSRYKAMLHGIDPNLEIALLKIEQDNTPHFDLNAAAVAEPGIRVLALSNLFKIATGNEMASVQRGVIMAVTELNARRGAFESVYQGPVAIIDATTNNPGAAGGALVNHQGKLVGLLGKELKDNNAGMWLNYAIPVANLKQSVETLLSGKSVARNKESRPIADQPATLAALGVVLVPNVLPRTPIYIDAISPGSAAEKAGLQRDDLVLFINSNRVASQTELKEELRSIDRSEQILLLVQRGKEITELVLKPQ